MSVLWDRQTASVAEVLAGINRKKAVSYSTVQTILRILETKGYVSHEQLGRAFIYKPTIDQRQARRLAIRQLVTRMFNGSTTLLVRNVLEDENVDAEELSEMRKLLADTRVRPQA